MPFYHAIRNIRGPSFGESAMSKNGLSISASGYVKCGKISGCIKVDGTGGM